MVYSRNTFNLWTCDAWIRQVPILSLVQAMACHILDAFTSTIAD